MKFFTRNNGAHSKKNGVQYRKRNVKKSKSLRAKEGMESLLFSYYDDGRREGVVSKTR